jgi:hypothetical protein
MWPLPKARRVSDHALEPSPCTRNVPAEESSVAWWSFTFCAVLATHGASPVLISSLVPVFHNVHSGSFSEVEEALKPHAWSA